MRDRDLVRVYWPIELRPAFDALFGIDDVMGVVVVNASQPALRAIKLAWWRAALERLDQAPPPGEPRLQAVAAELLNRGISGADVAGIEDGWAALLDEEIDWERMATRGERLFALAGRLLGADDAGLADAGRAFALGDAARRGTAVPTDAMAVARERLQSVRFPRTVRPLTALTRLALRNPREPEATPARAFALLRHRLTGRL
ncbi:hypothetical protein [Sphingomonas sp.]|uniref:hypothetical protein n=1 Tax=Sphingomonas sp. TaxID=28214 RepID=UPI00286B487C|nr:hypothetical protein [Sphingomonas sp.]